MDLADSDSDSDDELTAANPLEAILPEILAQLKHLDLSSRIFFKERNFVGGGAYGDIFRGRCSFPDRSKVKVAIKRLRFYLKEDIKTLFEKEIYVWSKLNHDNVLPLLGYAFANEYRCPLLVSEWMDRGSAWPYVKSHLRCDILHLMNHVSGIARGLTYLHEEGVVHSDIKSDNVLVSNSGDALLCDFGCARMISATRSFVNISTGIRGTSRYLAYELLALSAQTIGHTKGTDVWAFGMTVFELRTRQRPYAQLSDSQVIAAITRHELPSLPSRSEYWTSRDSEASQNLWNICLDCWNPNPIKRSDIKSILEKLLTLGPPASNCEHHGPEAQDNDSQDMVLNTSRRTGVEPAASEDPYASMGPSIGFIAPSTYIYPSLCSGKNLHLPVLRPALVGSFLDDMNLESLPPDMKREGADWFAIFNPKVKRVLDVHLAHVFKHESAVNCIRFSADGRFLATCCKRTIRLYDTNTGRRTCILYDGNLDSRSSSHIRSLCFSPDGKLLALEAVGNTIKLWEIAARRVTRVFQGHHQKINSTEFSKDGKFIVSGSADCTARIWDMDTGIKKVLQIKEARGVQAEITSVAISPDGQLVAAGSIDSVVCIWEVQSGNLVERLKGHRDSVYCVSFSPDGKSLLSGGLDKMIKQWNISALVASPTRRLPLPPAMEPIGHAPNLGAGDRPRPTRELPVPPVERPPAGAIIGNAALAELARERGERGSMNTMNFSGHNDCVLGVAMSPDGQWIASGSKDHGVYFLEESTAHVQLMLQGNKHSVLSIDFSPAGGMFATGCADKQTRIWSYRTV